MSTQTEVARFDGLARIRALSFDLDDTLWDCAPAIIHAEKKLVEWFEEHAPRIVAQHDRASLAAHRSAVLAEHPELLCDVTASRRLSIERLLVEFGYPKTGVDDAFSTFYRARSEVVLYDGVPALLERLGKRYALAAITNGNADLDAIGLSDHFAVILCASLKNPPKPAPDMFHDCLVRLGLEAHELLHIGDNVVTDVGGAQQAGIPALWFNGRGDAWPEHQPAPDLEAGSIAELGDILL